MDFAFPLLVYISLHQKGAGRGRRLTGKEKQREASNGPLGQSAICFSPFSGLGADVPSDEPSTA